MKEEEIIPIRAMRKLDMLFLRQDKKLQKEVIAWAKELMAECRQEWQEMHKTSISTVIKIDRANEAIRKVKIRDGKYRSFRIKFAELQKEQFVESLKNGQKFTANGFVKWFLQNKDKQIDIPYVPQNQKNKLIQLAQANNREFKKLYHDKAKLLPHMADCK